MSAVDTLLIPRVRANEMLGIPRRMSYRLLPRRDAHGFVRLSDIKTLLTLSAVDGAKWDGEPLVGIERVCASVPRRTALRLAHRLPRFVLSRKTVRFSASDLSRVLEGNTKTRNINP